MGNAHPSIPKGVVPTSKFGNIEHGKRGWILIQSSHSSPLNLLEALLDQRWRSTFPSFFCVFFSLHCMQHFLGSAQTMEFLGFWVFPGVSISWVGGGKRDEWKSMNI